MSILSAQKTADIMFTHDVHSQLDIEARAVTLIKQEREKNPDIFVFDAGDFSMGTLYQMLYKTEAVELRTMGMAGVDVTTLGNHEFDFGSNGLHDMLESAKNSGDKIPQIVFGNADWSNSKKSALVVKSALEDYGAKDYTVVQKGEIKIAVFGIFGSDALFCAPNCEVAIANQIESAKKIVTEIKAKENVDMIVCVSHSGTNKKSSKSEDENLAKKVPEIDLIVSGHTHTTLSSPIVHGNTYVVSCGAYSANLGHITLTQKSNGRWQLEKYELLPITENILQDAEVVAKLNNFSKEIDSKCLSKYELKSNEVLANNKDNLLQTDMGYVMADAMRKAAQDLEVKGENADIIGYGKPIDFVVIPSGCIRGIYKKGDVTVKDVFESFSLGTGADGLPGYPLVCEWATGKDLKSVAELDASLSPMMDTVLLYFSRMAFKYNPYRLILNKVVDGMIVNDDGTFSSLEDDKLYRVVLDSYTAQMMGSVVNITKGLVNITTRDMNGNPVTDINKIIIPTKDGELKGWYAIAYGLKQAKEISGYEGSRDKMKIEESSMSPAKIFSHPSYAAKIIYFIILILILIIVLVVVLCVVAHKKHSKKIKSSKNVD